MQSFIRTTSRPRERARDAESDARVAVVSIVSFSAHPLLCEKNLKVDRNAAKIRKYTGRDEPLSARAPFIALSSL